MHVIKSVRLLYMRKNVETVKTKSMTARLIAGIFIAITLVSFVNIGQIMPVNANGIKINALIVMKLLNSFPSNDDNDAPANIASGGKHGRIYVTSFEFENEKNINVMKNHKPKNIPSDFEISLHFPNMALIESYNVPVYGTNPAINMGMNQ